MSDHPKPERLLGQLAKPTSFKVGDVKALDNTYWLLLVNKSNLCLRFARMRRSGTQTWGGIFAIATICKNCTADFDTCANNHQFSPVVSTPNTDPPYDIQIFEQPDSQGNARGVEFDGITPNPQHSGAIVGVTDR